MMHASLPLSALSAATAPLLHAAAALRAALYTKSWVTQRRLRARVISVGNVAWGGTGKTPFVIWLARQLAAGGLQVSILARGYRRESREAVRVFPPGASPDEAVRDGDEAQLYLRHLRNVAVGIASSRYDAGRALEERFPVDVHLLDDGFQHLPLARDLDLVLVDVTNPWGGRAGVPRLLRESPSALRRASGILLTRCEALSQAGHRSLEDLQATLSKLNPRVPQFRLSTRLLRFVDAAANSTVSLAGIRGKRCAAFCGIASPDQFLGLLRRSGVECVAAISFRDHHRYRREDEEAIERLVREANAELLLTTEKDLVNLPKDARFSVPLYWAEIAPEVEDAAALLRWVRHTLSFDSATGHAAGRSGVVLLKR